MLENGIIRPSSSPWSSPIWIVPKKMDASGKTKWRIVVDYRKINEKTIDDRCPLPNINDILDKRGKCQYFTTLDPTSGFQQIEMDPESIPKTAFNVENGHYEYARMPFGLKNRLSHIPTRHGQRFEGTARQSLFPTHGPHNHFLNLSRTY
jgi:hypothetical protein